MSTSTERGAAVLRRRHEHAVAIIGAGMVGELHRRATLLQGSRVVGVLASSPQRSRQVADTWGVPHGFGDLGEVISSKADVVHVCTPNATHAPYVLELLCAGKHVVCEKPLGVTAHEAEQMAAAAAESGVVATVPFVYRYHPIVREARERRLRGEFGPWYLVHGSYLQDWMLSPDASGWRVDPGSGGASRAFADIGSHWCDLVEWVSGERFAEVTARTAVAVPERPEHGGASFGGTSSGRLVPVTTEDSATILLRTERGVLGTLTVSQVAAGRKNRLWFELDGARGSVVFDQEQPESIWLGETDQARVLVRDSAHGSAEQRRLSTLPAGHAQGYAQCFEAFVADTYAAIDGAEPAGLPGFADGVRSARIVEAVLESARTLTWTPVADGAQDF